MYMLHRITYNAMYLPFIAAEMHKAVDMIPELDGPIQFSGLETSSIPLMIALGNIRKVNAFSIRKERKTNGLFNLVNGDPIPGIPVVVVDDLVSSGGGCHRCIDAIKYELALPVAPIILSIVRNDQTHYVTHEGSVYQVEALFTKKEFSTEYDEEEYFLPADVDKTKNKRPEYI
jgi:orotate phosphoribosyltransferase